MAGGKSDNPANPSAVRIRDNQRRSRARHKEYVEGLQKKIQDYERRGVEATLEMQQAARNVAIENSRLRTLLGYRGVTNEEIDKFLQAFPGQGPTEAAKAAISQPPSTSQAPIAIAPKMPLQPLMKHTSNPVRTEHVVPRFSPEHNRTRSVVDAIVGITREPRQPNITASSGQLNSNLGEHRQAMLQPRPPQVTSLPPLPAVVPVPLRLSPNPIDKLSVLATASVQQDAGTKKHFADDYDAPSPPTMGPSPAMSQATTVTGRVHSTSPRDRPLPYMGHEMSCNAAARIISDMNGEDSEAAKAALACDGREECQVRNTAIFRIMDAGKGI